MVRLFGFGTKPKTFQFKCADCGDIHRGSPSFAWDKPGEYFMVPEHLRKERVTLNDDLCTITLPGAEVETEYYIRTILEIPIHGCDEPFTWGLWVSQSEDSFRRYQETFNEDQSGDGSFGWLGVWMRPYDRRAGNNTTEYLACDVEWGHKNTRPTVFLHECDHPLYIDQRDGIEWDRAIEISTQIIHPPQPVNA